MAKREPSGNALHFCCCGVRIRIEADHGIPLAKVREILPPGFIRVDAGDSDHRFRVSLGDGPNEYIVRSRKRRAATAPSLDEAIDELRQRVHLCVAEHSPDRVFVHAGVVRWKGHAIVCPGRSLAGKSTLVEFLLKEGATYYSDEYAVFDAAGNVHPFPLPINRRLGGNRKQRIQVLDPGAQPLSEVLFLFAIYRNNACWRPHTLSPAQTVLSLLRNAPAMRRNPKKVLRVLARVASRAESYTGRRGEANEVLEWLVLNYRQGGDRNEEIL